ncbi:30S ribosomal protein S6e [Anopheles sinensis]|uniref:30S ribosomal protein S6e n=1 Tax=Anopheles sinensis TaxID=74873 RepID=A0A084VFZ4_ANOSI|nr:30S ribosomal protein S6e [Anopheles sinensis]
MHFKTSTTRFRSLRDTLWANPLITTARDDGPDQNDAIGSWSARGKLVGRLMMAKYTVEPTCKIMIATGRLQRDEFHCVRADLRSLDGLEPNDDHERTSRTLRQRRERDETKEAHAAIKHNNGSSPWAFAGASASGDRCR